MQRLSSRSRLLGLLAVALLLRLLFIKGAGFAIDVGDFEGWATQLATSPLAAFYNGAGFADYPPGYLYVLWIVGHVYGVLAPHGNPALFLALIKLPAILADLGAGALLYALVRRYASESWALAAAACFALNPAAIFVSAWWGQVDSVSAALALLAIYLVVRASEDGPDAAWFLVEAWLALAASLLIKPQAAILAPLFVAFVFASRDRLRERSIATLGGLIGALALAIVVARPFHPVGNPFALLGWLAGIYSAGYGGYAFDSVNAFDLWTIGRPFWQSDAQPIFGLSQHLWGILLFLGATLLIVWRYLQRRSVEAFVEAAALLALGFFVLMTRMHERYVFDALLFLCATVPLARRYLAAVAAVSLTFFANMLYSLQYLAAVTHGAPGSNATDLWGFGDHALSFVNVAVFFALGYLYLSGESRESVAPAPAAPRVELAPVRAEGDPLEGRSGLLWPLDHALALGIAAASFVLLWWNYWFPKDKIFDEIYFARAAEEYLTRNYIYESTHPPVTKLLITFSTWLFGGMAHGDTSYGWRFLDVLFGAALVWLLYVFAKRVTGSTLFASCAAVLLALDGQHFVQSRIATPEAFVAFFSLAAIYTFYRFWLASQDREHRPLDRATVAARLAGVAGAIALAAVFTALRFGTESFATKVVLAVYVTSGLYLLYRLLVEPRVLHERPLARPRDADLWLGLFALSTALLVTSKWYGVMIYGIAIVIVLGVRLQPVLGTFYAEYLNRERPPFAWGNPYGFRLDVVFCAALFALGTVYALAYVPHFIGLKDLPQSPPRPYTVTDVVNMQVGAYHYHHDLKATHPYQSVWWQWPLDIRPVMYYAKYGGSGNSTTAAVIYTLPNPIILWFGLLAVPLVGILAWREKHKGYALIVIAYLAQWLPWIATPRIAWNYHFYVNVALICLCNAIVLQRLWQRGWKIPAALYVAAVAAAFVFFYPILAGVTEPTWAWTMRQWLHSWV